MEGTPDEAARHCAAIVRLAGHASNDRCLISSLVGIAIFVVFDLLARRLLGRWHDTELPRG
jgi:hypothetical protein